MRAPWGFYHFHLLPVVREFFPAFQTDDIGTGKRSSLIIAPGAVAHGDGETVIAVPAAKERIE